MRRIKVMLLSLGLYVVGPFAHGDDFKCVEQGEIRIPNSDGSERVEKASYCYKLKPYELISANCRTHTAATQPTCRALSLKEMGELNDLNPYGTPGAHLCLKLGGYPQVIFFQAGTKAPSFDRCVFSEDGSFVDLGTLWLRHKTVPTPPKEQPVSPGQKRSTK